MVGNKNDMYEFQEVTNDEGLSLAKNINAMYQITSAKNSSGIDELFKNLGKKFLDPQFENTSTMTKEERKNRGEKIMRDNIKNTQKKKKCCS